MFFRSPTHHADLAPPTAQQARMSASCATRELDELMASLSDFKVGRWPQEAHLDFLPAPSPVPPVLPVFFLLPVCSPPLWALVCQIQLKAPPSAVLMLISPPPPPLSPSWPRPLSPTPPTCSLHLSVWSCTLMKRAGPVADHCLISPSPSSFTATHPVTQTLAPPPGWLCHGPPPAWSEPVPVPPPALLSHP